MDFMAFGSSLSLRNMFRSGSSMSVLGKTFIQSSRTSCLRTSRAPR
jgi:hypothetical protein